MPSLKDIRVKPTLTSLFLRPVLIVCRFSRQKAETSLFHGSFNQLTAVRNINKNQLNKYMHSIASNIDSLKKTVLNVIQAGSEKWMLPIASKKQRLN